MANQAPVPKGSPQNPKKVTNEEKRNDQATKNIAQDGYDVVQEGDTKEPIVNIKRTDAIEPAVLIGRDGIPSQEELEAAAKGKLIIIAVDQRALYSTLCVRLMIYSSCRSRQAPRAQGREDQVGRG